MSFSVLQDDSVQGLDPLVLSLEEFSRKMEEIAVARDVSPADEIQLTGWVERPRNGSCKLAGRRSTPSIPKHLKEQRSTSNRRAVSRQLTANREDSMGFKHYLEMGRYIEEYRNDKILRQEAALKELLNRNERCRMSGSCLDSGKSVDNSEHFTIKQAPSVVSMKEVPSTEDDNETKPFIVVSSKGLVRPSNLPVSGLFQSRKLQNRPTVRDRRVNQSRVTQWSQAHNNATLEVTSYGNSDANHTRNSSRQDEAYYQTLIETRSAGNLMVNRSELSPSPTSSGLDIKSVLQTCHAVPQRTLTVEKCDAWVKNRDHNLQTVKGSKEYCHREQFKARPFRTLPSPVVSSQLVMRGNTLLSSQKDSLSGRTSESSTSSSSLPGMDYSQYTDMFKNVLEFYGTKRLRPKSESTVEQLLSMKS